MTFLQFIKKVHWTVVLKPNIEWFYWIIGIALLSALSGTPLRPWWANVLIAELGWIIFWFVVILLSIPSAYLKAKNQP